ncbi:MAG: HAMP domain-containing histidine kinase [Erysipelothrix sp.]|nr:HAMP domain-containing histidine kinase [Erysipelothrix sp.]
MKRKINGIQTLKRVCLLFVVFLLIMVAFNQYQYELYTRNFNRKIDSLISYIVEKYPETNQVDILNIITSESDYLNTLRDYGIDIDKDSLVPINDDYYVQFFVSNLILVSVFFALMMLVLTRYDKGRREEIEKITQTIEQINQHNYDLQIDDNREDELSILKNEITKTTVMLREIADNSLKDKLSLKTSLADISHQIRTPLTSVTVMLENLYDNADMEQTARLSLIRKTKQEMATINQLIESLLILSKLDSNTLSFKNENVKVLSLITTAIERVDIAAELKNVNIEIMGPNDITLNIDKKWQVEAMTNILKNGIEHSHEGSTININFSENKLFTRIDIQDHGLGIDQDDLPHIFKRFYKGKNYSKNSIGIGLALSKSLIEDNGGSISVSSQLNKGTLFSIKYYFMSD